MNLLGATPTVGGREPDSWAAGAKGSASPRLKRPTLAHSAGRAEHFAFPHRISRLSHAHPKRWAWHRESKSEPESGIASLRIPAAEQAADEAFFLLGFRLPLVDFLEGGLRYVGLLFRLAWHVQHHVGVVFFLGPDELLAVP